MTQGLSFQLALDLISCDDTLWNTISDSSLHSVPDVPPTNYDHSTSSPSKQSFFSSTCDQIRICWLEQHNIQWEKTDYLPNCLS